MFLKSMKPFQVSAQLNSIRFTADKGLSLMFHTQELSNEEKVSIGEYHYEQGWLCFKPNEWKDEELPTSEAKLDGQKTPSQRLRGVIFKYWKQQEGRGDFEDFYRKQLEVFIDKIKEKLDD